MRRILFLFLSIIAILNAKSYESIVYSGLIHLSELSAAEISGIEPGKDISEQDIDNAIIKLFSQEYFTDIKAEDNTTSLIFYFKEKPVIASIEFKGSSETEVDEKLKPLVNMKKGEIFHEEKIEQSKKRIMQMMRSDGYFDTIVEADVKNQNDDSVTIEFQINKGETIIITEQNFDGLVGFEHKDIQSDLANKEEESLGWFLGRSDGKLKLDQLEFDFQRIKNFYMKNGYLDAEISEPLLSVDFDQYAAKLFYSIEEGIAYSIGEVEIKLLDGNLSLDGIEDLLKIKTGKIFNIEKMRKDLKTIEDKIGSQGYAFARIFPDIKKDKERGIADVVYAIKPGEKVYIRDVIVSGNSRTLDRVVRREVFLAPGDLYSSVELRESKNSLGRLGFFKNIDIQEKRITEDKIDLIVKVEETHTASLSAGAGYGSQNGFMLNASVTDRNIFGSGMRLSLTLEESERTKRADFSIFNPRVNDSDYSLGTSFYVNEADYSSYDSYNQQKSISKGVTLKSGKKLSRYWNTSASLGYSSTDITYKDSNTTDDINTTNPYLIEGETRIISLTPFIGFDNTDDYFTPRSGSTFSASAEFAGFGMDQEYISNNIKYSYYYGLEDLIDFDAILRYRVKGAYIFADSSDYVRFPINSRLRMGGTRTIRGYRTGSISPVKRDGVGALILESDGKPTYLGGNQMIVNNFEINIPLVPESGLRASIFYDHGAIGQDDFSEERKGYGISLDWITPMAPLQFIFGWAIDPKKYDETTTFEFTMGQRF